MIKLLSIADVVTLTNVTFGFMAIIMAFLNEIRFSFSFILLALLADGLDGVVARRTRKGELGEYFEAMADMTSLGIAPAIFVYFVYVTYHDAVSCCIYRHIILVAVLIVFLSMSVIRLASFHIMKDKNFFVGLPASASTIIILTLAFFEIEFLYILPVIVIVSLVMLSNVRFPKPGFKMDAMAAILIILTLIIGKNYGNVAPLILLSMIMVYVIAGPVYLWKAKKSA